MPIRELIDGLGGPTRAAALFGVSVGAISMWKLRGEVPPGHHLRAWQLALERGLPWQPPGGQALRSLLQQRAA